MEQSISSLAFKGSIIEAITEAKRQKKLFLVYISGDNEDSISMDKSTWSESKVAESLSKYCILLHILEGSTDAAQFSALYPQKPAPCITAIGYNGIQLWQNEGFVSGEVLVSTLEKAWLSIHVQETFLSAALASRQSEQIPSEIPPSTSPEIGSSSISSINTNSSLSVDKKDVNHEKNPENSAPEQKKLKVGDDVSRVPVVHKPEESKSKQPVTVKEPVKKTTTSTNESKVDKKSSLKTNQDREENVVKPPKAVKDVTNSENLETELILNKSTDIHINIRLPGGKSLQEKFEPTTTLKVVKNYVDQNQESSIGPYDLAIPYPRKVFTDQDLTKSLSELSLLDRQALIVVPHLQSNKPRSYSLPNQSETATSSPDGEGYFSLWKRALSYINPLAYLGANTAPERSLPESGSEPDSFSGSRRSDLVTQNQPSSSRFGSGSNIHTLKHDEDDSKFSGKNAFWNGNSTEYGGDGDNK